MKSPWIIASLVLLSMLSLLSPPCLAGQKEDVVVKVYNISDLLWARKDYPFESGVKMPPTMPPTRGDGVEAGRRGRTRRFEAPPAGGGGGGGRGLAPAAAPVAAEPDPQSVIIDQLTQLLRETVDPPSWAENGGFGAMRVLGGMLVVSQTAANQQSLANMLQQIRAESSRLVTVKAHWVLLSSADYDALLPRGEEKKNSAANEINVDALAKLGDKVLHYRGQTSCFNGQTVHLSSGRGRTSITDIEAVTGDGVGLYNAVPQIVQAGAMLQLTPMLGQDGKQAVVDLQSVVSEWDEPAAGKEVLEPTTRPGAASAIVDRINVVVQQLRTTVQVPVGKPVLVGGMTFEPNSKTPNAPQMYLIIEVTAGN